MHVCIEKVKAFLKDSLLQKQWLSFKFGELINKFQMNMRKEGAWMHKEQEKLW